MLLLMCFSSCCLLVACRKWKQLWLMGMELKQVTLLLQLLVVKMVSRNRLACLTFACLRIIHIWYVNRKLIERSFAYMSGTMTAISGTICGYCDV